MGRSEGGGQAEPGERVSLRSSYRLGEAAGLPRRELPRLGPLASLQWPVSLQHERALLSMLCTARHTPSPRNLHMCLQVAKESAISMKYDRDF